MQVVMILVVVSIQICKNLSMSVKEDSVRRHDVGKEKGKKKE